MNVGKLQPGQAVRIEKNAVVVEQVKDNPSCYVVRYESDETETITLSRINAIMDMPRAALDFDCYIQVSTPRLSAAGARSLLLWLKTHEHKFQEAVQGRTETS